MTIREDETFIARPLKLSKETPVRAVGRQADGSKIRTTLNVNSPPARIEVEDAFFNFDSAVMMPDTVVNRALALSEPFHAGDQTFLETLRKFHPDVHRTLTIDPPSPPASEDNHVGGLGVLAATYRFLALNSQFKLLLAGHTDTTGNVDYNFLLSQKRAKNVLFLLQGDRQAWVKGALDHSRVEDQKRICKHAARTRGWPCDPGIVDNNVDAALNRALRGLRENFNRDFGRSIRVDGPADAETWGAFFDIYMDELADILNTDVDGLASHRNQLRFVNDKQKFIACGEKLPIEEPQRDSFRSEENRRVEILFFASSALPDFHCHAGAEPFCMKTCKRDECGVYAPGLFTFISIDPGVLGALRPGRRSEGKFEIVDSKEDLGQLADKPDDQYVTRVRIRDVDAQEDPWEFLTSFLDLDPSQPFHEILDSTQPRSGTEV